jgi:hypothetical protein
MSTAELAELFKDVRREDSDRNSAGRGGGGGGGDHSSMKSNDAKTENRGQDGKVGEAKDGGSGGGKEEGSREKNPFTDDELAKIVSTTHFVYTPTVLALISSWPFILSFQQFLQHLYDQYGRQDAQSHKVPLESCLQNFMFEVPLPPLGPPRTMYKLKWVGGGDRRPDRVRYALTLERPPPNRLPICDVDLRWLFRLLSPERVVATWMALLTEQRVVLCSSKPLILHSVAHALVTLLFPFTWQGVYMPLLPSALGEFMYAPVPFIAGISTQ